jgi:hypothetical protein
MQDKATKPRRRYTYHTRPQAVPRVCERCGATCLVAPAHLSRGRGAGRYCSLDCWRAEQQDWINHPERYFASKVDKSGDCWVWIGHHYSNGYGFFRLGAQGPTRLAHRFAWEAASGTAPTPGQVVLHTCDNRACVRNDEKGTYIVRGVVLPRFGHLALGTRMDNQRDMSDKGRGVIALPGVVAALRQQVRQQQRTIAAMVATVPCTCAATGTHSDECLRGRVLACVHQTVTTVA